MRLGKFSTLALAALLALAGGPAGRASVKRAAAPRQTSVVYRLDPARSKFMIRAFAGGLLWFKGHDHFVQARDFKGEARLTPGSVSPASLTLDVRAASLVETREVFTDQQKKIIDGELRDIVLEPAKYPDITFKSTEVSVEPHGGAFKVTLGGDLTLRGSTRHVRIPAEVTLEGDALRARGEFDLKRSDFKVPATSAAHGTVRVRDRLKISFDIVARRD